MASSSSTIPFDPSLVPFSRFGSYLALSLLPEGDDRPGGLYLRNVRGPAFGDQALFFVELTHDGVPCPFTCKAEPTQIKLSAEAGSAEICFSSMESIRVRTHGVGVRFTLDAGGYNNLIPAFGGWLATVCSHMEVKLLLRILSGDVNVDAPWKTTRSERIQIDLAPVDGVAECDIAEFRINPPIDSTATSFDACRAFVVREFSAWLLAQPDVPDRYREAAALAAYINWSCVVAASGNLPRPAMYMSKNRMANIWSWDHCFNALPLATHLPELAWDQLLIMFDLQDASGVLPDLANDLFSSWSFCKPPVHGWALRRLLADAPQLADRADEVYEPLARWTLWWFQERTNGDLPHYFHGNDCGWDNATVFDFQPPIESADLCAYLILQMEMLAELAKKLDKADEVSAWNERSSLLLERLIDTFWREDHFIARQTDSRGEIDTDSLFLYLPILLGERLPQPIRAAMIDGLKRESRFLTPFGLATEAITSEHYTPDGYWRGPIWGAPTLMITEGLEDAGEVDFANDIRRRFCDMVAKSCAAQNGLAENYNALTGDGLRDRAFTWTASIFLVLASELHRFELAET